VELVLILVPDFSGHL